jgi:hypothetical protein
MKAGRERLEHVIADSLLEAIAAACVPKGTLDLPVRSHARRMPSGQRGMSRAMLRAIRGFYGPRGALGKLMGDLIIEEGFEASVCALTRSTGLSLIESLALTAEARGEVADALIGLATTFFSYSWEGTKLGDMLDAIERRLAELEAADGVTRYVWIDIFAASQTLLSGEFDAGRYTPGSEAHTARAEAASARPPVPSTRAKRCASRACSRSPARSGSPPPGRWRSSTAARSARSNGGRGSRAIPSGSGSTGSAPPS